MAQTGNIAFEGDLARLTNSYVERLEHCAQATSNILTQRQMSELTRDDYMRAQALAHGLAGSGSIFGFPEVTDIGRKIDLFLLELLKEYPSANIPADEISKFEELMGILRMTCETVVHEYKQQPAHDLAELTKSGILPKSFHVVVVDDDRELSAFLSAQLKHRGIRVTVAENGIAALREIKRNPPDLIILDISMPGMSGHEVLREVKQTPELVTIPTLILTGNTQRADTVSAYHAGAIDYVIKPYDPQKLMERVEGILEAALYTVMIVDNDDLVQQLLNRKFHYAGYKTILINDGKEAWDRILRELPDLIILDRMMPGMEGLAVLKNIRAEEATADIPVIILSARQESRDIEAGLKMGAQEYIIKPFITDQLLERSINLLKKKKSRRYN